MSKFFYHGKANNNNERGSASFGGNKVVRLGSKNAPAQISVKTEARKAELEAILKENKWIAEVTLDAEKSEDIRDLGILQATAETQRAVTSKKANRNDPCPCGSEKKYKKCCGA